MPFRQSAARDTDARTRACTRAIHVGALDGAGVVERILDCPGGKQSNAPPLPSGESTGPVLRRRVASIMTATIERPPCASCGGSNLTPGNFGFQFRFVPAGFAGVIWNAYQPAGAACLDCGFIGPYLTPAQIAKLRGKLERRAGAAKGG